MSGSGSGAQAAAGLVLVTLAAGQFLMTLDTSVMNVAIATVAEDVGTDVTGIQTAITLYTLVMATLMITGGKIGALIGRKRAVASALRSSEPPPPAVRTDRWRCRDLREQHVDVQLPALTHAFPRIRPALRSR